MTQEKERRIRTVHTRQVFGIALFVVARLTYFLLGLGQRMSSITIGVLALQGAFAEHIELLNKFPNVVAREIKQTKDMEGVDGLILPGGESTVQGKWLAASDLGDTLRHFSQVEGKPTFGTCAGFILLANKIKKTSEAGLLSEKEGGQYRLHGMNVEIERNYFGRQIDSFEADITSEVIGVDPFHAVFIRAPAVHEGDVYGDRVRVLASVQHRGRKMIVAVQENNFLGTSFHPELTTDTRWHQYFVKMVRANKGTSTESATTTTTPAEALITTSLPDLHFLAKGKVRDIYTVDEEKLLFVTTDRISAYDVIMKNGIPDKGKILTALSEFWFEKLSPICAHHLITTRIEEMPESVHPYKSQLSGRSMLVKKMRILPIEAIVRGYITGSAWKEYQQSGTVHGIRMPPGLQESQRLPNPLFTPSTKAEQGEHDENIHPDQVAGIIGAANAKKMEQLALKLYSVASEFALTKGIIIADTKFEFGLVQSNVPQPDALASEAQQQQQQEEEEEMVLVDEVLTPDSSRFWPAQTYRLGKSQESFDKQYLRDYLTSHHIDKQDGVEIPEEIVVGTSQKYAQVYSLLTGRPWAV